MTHKKLYSLTSETFELLHYVDDGCRVVTRLADNIPMMSLPDGRWCHHANAYMQSLWEAGRSRRDRGSTLFTYAGNLSHLIRYCYYNSIDFHQLTDSRFTLFINGLTAQKRQDWADVAAREPNTVIAIGRECLKFLLWLSNYSGYEIIGANGSIRAERRETRVILPGGKVKAVQYWHHSSFPTPSPLKRRLPVTRDVIVQLQLAAAQMKSTPYVRQRRLRMLKLLEVFGPRRAEVAALTTDHLESASYNTSYGKMIQVPTVKKERGGKASMREVPFPAHELAELETFVDFYRKSLTASLLKAAPSRKISNHVLLSEKTGRGLMPNTITQEIYALARFAKIPGRVCAHMFRHRFITKHFIELIKEHKCKNVDSLRSLILDTETLKAKVAEWTGHSNIESLVPYMHLAFEEISGIQETVDLTLKRLAFESLASTFAVLDLELQTGTDPSKIQERLRSFFIAGREIWNKDPVLQAS